MAKEIVETTFDKDGTIYQMGFLFMYIQAHAHTDDQTYILTHTP